jgi:hypothetical protein
MIDGKGARVRGPYRIIEFILEEGIDVVSPFWKRGNRYVGEPTESIAT